MHSLGAIVPQDRRNQDGPPLRAGQQKLAGAEGFEPPSPVLETSSLTVELTPLHPEKRRAYLVSLWAVCLRHRLQNFENSSRAVVFFLFFVVE